jgi:hypothetical protein
LFPTSSAVIDHQLAADESLVVEEDDHREAASCRVWPLAVLPLIVMGTIETAVGVPNKAGALAAGQLRLGSRR